MRLQIALCFACLACVTGERVYLQDLNEDHDKRNLNFGLADNMRFNLRHSGGDLELNFKENKRVNQRAPMFVTDPENSKRAMKVDVARNNKIKYYQDMRNGAYVIGECEINPHGPCTRKLTGNVHIDGREYKLEPAIADKRTFDIHLGTAHNLELLETRSFASRANSDNNLAVTGFIDDAIPHPAASHTSHSVMPEKHMMTEETKEELLEDLLEKLEDMKSIKKRDARPLYSVEMLMVLDHYVYQKFEELHTGDATIMLKMREYYCHILNGVDLRYKNIDDVNGLFYVTVVGFFVSKTEGDSPWMDYSTGNPEGLAGLQYMRGWSADTAGLPDHDHAALITGTDFNYQGSQGVVGLAYLNGVCNYYRVSLNEEYGFFKGAGVLAHELGHNLGSGHDSGSSGDPCDSQKKYIMQPYVPSVSTTSTYTEPWFFSSCSIAAFIDYASGLTQAEQCMLDNPDIYDEDEFNGNTDNLAGTEYTADEQCELLMGDGATTCHTDISAICRAYKCTKPGSGCQTYVAAYGTPCGENMMCFNGLCVDTVCKGRQCEVTNGPTTDMPTTTTTAPDDSFVCKDRGVGGYSCDELTDIMGNAKSMCNLFARDCCETCTIKKNCKKEKALKFGKTKKSCAVMVDEYGFDTVCNLFTKNCCKTCAP